MRHLIVSVAGFGLLAAAGCSHMAGKCDCDNTPLVACVNGVGPGCAGPVGPGAPPPPGPGPLRPLPAPVADTPNK